MSTEFINDQWRLPNAWNGSESNVNKQSNYSMDFDSASSDYIDAGNPTELQITGALTISYWFKTTNTGYQFLVTKDDATNSCFGVGLRQQKIYATIFSSGLTDIETTTTWIDGNWHNVVFVFTPSTSMEIFVDGNSEIRETTAIPSSIDNDSANLNIGRRGNNTRYYTGQIDGVAIFNYALTDGTGGTVNQISALYGSSSTGIGNPMSLSPKPVAYYPLGDQDAFNGSNYLVPNIAAEEDDGDIATSYSPYALDFDSASSDYVQCSTLTNYDDGDFSVSIWLYRESGVLYGRVIGNSTATSRAGFDIATINTNILFTRRTPTKQASTNYIDILTYNTWHNVVGTYNDSTGDLKLYLDGVLKITVSATSSSIPYSSVQLAMGTTATVPYSQFLSGKLSNASIWNTALTSTQVTEIYNEGVPSNLNNHSAYSNLVSWWQLGSNSSFNTNWTVLDEKGSNNGTSVNMGEDAIVDGVGSYANGVGTSGLEVVGSAPFSDANSLSVNMDVEDRVTGISNATITTGGTGYATGTNIATTGGTGSGCTVDITASGAITAVTINNSGLGYSVGEVLTVVQSGGSSGTITVTSLNTPS